MNSPSSSINQSIVDEDFLMFAGAWYRVTVEPHYAAKDFRVDYRTSPVHGWRSWRELTREQVTELRDMLSLALEGWTYEH